MNNRSYIIINTDDDMNRKQRKINIISVERCKMNKIRSYISSQFKNPRGAVGRGVTLLQNIINKKMYKKAVSLVNVSQDDSILDIGYGNGHLLKMIYDKCMPDMYGIDISDDAMAMATKRNRKALSDGRLQLTVGDCCELPYDENMFSAITTINTVYFWSDTVKGLSEIRRCLKPGCSFYNVAFTKEYLDKVKYTETGYRKFEEDELVQYGKDAGFENIEIKEIVKGSSFVVVYTK